MTEPKRLVVVVPAYNEERYLGATLSSLAHASAALPPSWQAEIVVVDDQSEDATQAVASTHGARVVRGGRCGIGAARNIGAACAPAVDVLVFVDADTTIPSDLLGIIVGLMDDASVKAISVPSDYTTDRRSLRPLLAWWRWYAPRHRSTQGVFQAFDAGLFARLGGYDEQLRMAEDTDLFDRAVAMLGASEWIITPKHRVRASARRYEQAGLIELWLLTNPITTRYLRRSAWLWRRWYRNPPR